MLKYMMMMKIKFPVIKPIDLLCLIPSIFFIVLTLPYWGETAPMDGMVYYRQTTQFFAYGPLVAFLQNNFIHPPLFYVLQGVFYKIFGLSPQSYTLLGYSLLVITSTIFYFTVKQIFKRRIALIATLLLFMNPHMIVNSFYPNPDIFLLSAFIFTLFAHTYNKKRWLMCCYVLLFLAKDTGLVIYAGLMFIRSLNALGGSTRTKLKAITQEILISIPILTVFLLWSSYTESIGANWKEIYLHEETTETSYIVFALKKILTLGFLNGRLIQSIFNIFTLNFQWIYTTLLLILWFIFFKNPIVADTKQRRFIHALLFTSVLYLCVVLSFPTWTIPRYGITMLLPLFVFLSLYINQIKRPLLYSATIIMLLIITVMSNVSSVDPISSQIGLIPSVNTWIYNSGFNTNGPDGFLYNFQFMKPVSLQNALLQRAFEQNADYIVTGCDEYKIGERLYSISLNPEFYPQFHYTKPLECLSDEQFWEKFVSGGLASTRVFFPTGPSEGTIQSFYDN